MAVYTCGQCGVEFAASHRRKSNKCGKFFCTKTCHYTHTRKQPLPVRSYDDLQLARPCMQCGMTVRRSRAFALRAKRFFCSPSCFVAFKKDNTKARMHEKGYWYLRHRPVHVLIVEKVLGRSLKKGEVVHHINGDKSDNRNENLLVCTQSYHAWLHHHMSQLYMREHFGSKPSQTHQ